MMMRISRVIGLLHDPDFDNFRESAGPIKFYAIMKEAADRGTRNHFLFSKFFSSLSFTQADAVTDQERADFLEPLIAWAKANVLDVISIEERFTNDKLGFTGKPDLNAVLCATPERKEGPFMIEYKFTAKLPRFVRLQLAAQTLLKYGPGECGGVCLHFRHADGWHFKPHLFTGTQFDVDRYYFQYLLSIANAFYVEKDFES